MWDFEHSLSGSSSVEIMAEAALMLLVYLVCLVLIGGAIYGVYFLLTLPMRRRERARLFLDLLELGMNQGRTPEATVIGVAASQDRSLGTKFYLAADYLKEGLRLSRALEKVPRLLPPEVVAMLAAGECSGDMKKVLPACRQLLRDGVSQVRGGLNYLLLLVFAVSPALLAVPVIVRVKVLPKMNEVFQGMSDGQHLPAFTRMVFGLNPYSLAVQAAILLFIWVLAVGYIGGPRLREFLRSGFPWLVDSFFYWLPWRRKRMQRDFSTMLAVLLDSGAPEDEALTWAAKTTCNGLMISRAAKARKLLGQGVKLSEAIRVLDETQELQWRLANALARGKDFLTALSGWHESLDAKAFQLEQSAAQVATTIVVLCNGVLVASIVIAVFLVIIQLINAAVLW